MNPDNPTNEAPETMPVSPEPVMSEPIPTSTPEAAPAAKAATAGSTIPMGPVLGVLLVVIVLALGALYVIGQMNDTDDLETEDPLIEAMGEQSTSTAISAIEADLNSTDMDAIDAELEAAFKDAEAAQ